MAMVYAELFLANPAREELEKINVNAFVATGQQLLCVPTHIATQLQLKEYERRIVTFSDGSQLSCPYVGPVHIKFEDRQCITGALVFGDEVLLGVIPLEDMNLLVLPAQHKVIPSPENISIRGAMVK